MLTNHTTIDTVHGIIDLYWTDEEIIMTYRKDAGDVMIEIELPTNSEVRRARVERVLGINPFNPYDRSPTEVEVESLEADGLTRESFETAERCTICTGYIFVGDKLGPSKEAHYGCERREFLERFNGFH